MRLRNLALIGAAALFAAPVFATTFYGGIEDWKSLDYDYNDVVFSVTGNALQLNSSGQWFTQPALGTSASPFWNHSSLDGPKDNIGYCIYGGGTCNGGAALDPGARYLATSKTSYGSANDVTFSSTGTVQLAVLLENTKAKDSVGWYALSDPNSVHWLGTPGATGTYSFDPTGAFGLVMMSSMNGKGYQFYSDLGLGLGATDYVSHFAFFDPVPEPAAMGLMLFGLLGVAGLAWRRKIALQS